MLEWIVVILVGLGVLHSARSYHDTVKDVGESYRRSIAAILNDPDNTVLTPGARSSQGMSRPDTGKKSPRFPDDKSKGRVRP